MPPPPAHRKLLRRAELRVRVPLQDSQIYYLMSLGLFPRPIRIGLRAVAWIEDEIEAWIAERAADRDAGKPSRAA